MAGDLSRCLATCIILSSLTLGLSVAVGPPGDGPNLDFRVLYKGETRRLPFCLSGGALSNATCPCDSSLCQLHASALSDGTTIFCLPANITSLCYRSEMGSEGTCGCCVVQTNFLC